MIDIWGRPLSKSSLPTTSDSDIKKIIENEIAETLNLTSVDPNEIVIFQDKTGKLKSSNVSLDDILVRKRGVADNAIVLFQEDGRLKPGAVYSTITDTISLIRESLMELASEYNKHIKTFTNFRKNINDKIDTKTSDIKQSLDKISVINSRIDTITENLEKIKISHAIQSGTFEWISDNNDKLDITVPVKGIYRLTLISLYKFDIISSNSVGVNNTISTIIDKDKPERFTITNPTINTVRAKVTWCIEFISK